MFRQLTCGQFDISLNSTHGQFGTVTRSVILFKKMLLHGYTFYYRACRYIDFSGDLEYCDFNAHFLAIKFPKDHIIIRVVAIKMF